MVGRRADLDHGGAAESPCGHRRMAGSEAAIKGRHATWWSRYNHEQPRAEKVQTILDWLSLPASEAPSLLVGYFHEVDGAGHTYGPSAPQVDSAIAQVDSALGA